MSLTRRLAALEKRHSPRFLQRFTFIRDGAQWIGLARPNGPMIMALPHNGRDDLPEQNA